MSFLVLDGKGFFLCISGLFTQRRRRFAGRHESSRIFETKVRKSKVAGSAASLPGVWGVPRNSFYLFCAPPQAARGKKESFGDTPDPGQGLAALDDPAFQAA